MDSIFDEKDPGHKVLTYVEYIAVSVLTPHPPSPTSECVLPPHLRRGVHTRRAVRGVGGQYFWKTPDIGLASCIIISLRSGRNPVYLYCTFDFLKFSCFSIFLKYRALLL